MHLAAHHARIGQIIVLGPEKTHPALIGLPGVRGIVSSLREFDRVLFDYDGRDAL
jgi:hypothetical protein